MTHGTLNLTGIVLDVVGTALGTGGLAAFIVGKDRLAAAERALDNWLRTQKQRLLTWPDVYAEFGRAFKEPRRATEHVKIVMQATLLLVVLAMFASLWLAAWLIALMAEGIGFWQAVARMGIWAIVLGTVVAFVIAFLISWFLSDPLRRLWRRTKIPVLREILGALAVLLDLPTLLLLLLASLPVYLLWLLIYFSILASTFWFIRYAQASVTEHRTALLAITFVGWLLWLAGNAMQFIAALPPR